MAVAALTATLMAGTASAQSVCGRMGGDLIFALEARVPGLDQHTVCAKVGGHAFLFARGPAMVEWQQHGTDARQRQHHDDVGGVVAQGHADQLPRRNA